MSKTGPYGQFLFDLMSDDALLRRFAAKPEAVMNERRLTGRQKRALLKRDADLIEAEFRIENGGDKGTGFVRVPVPPTASPPSHPVPTGFVRGGSLIDRLTDGEDSLQAGEGVPPDQ